MRLDLHDGYGYAVILTVNLDDGSTSMSEPGIYSFMHNIAYIGS